MYRGEVWWARLPEPKGVRPVLLLSRDRAIQVRPMVTVAPLTRTIREIASQVRLGPEDGLPKPCVANLDDIQTIEKSRLLKRLCALSESKLRAVAGAVQFALALD